MKEKGEDDAQMLSVIHIMMNNSQDQAQHLEKR